MTPDEKTNMILLMHYYLTHIWLQLAALFGAMACLACGMYQMGYNKGYTQGYGKARIYKALAATDKITSTDKRTSPSEETS